MRDNFAHPLNILELLDNAVFPAHKTELVQHAQDNDASEEALDQLQALPERIFLSISDLNRHLSDIENMPGSGNLWSSQDSGDLPQPKDVALAQLRGQGRV